DAIAGGGLVHLFGTGHSRMSVEEMFPRYGSYPGFHPMVELSTTFHTQVVGTNGQRQAMFIERTEGLAEVILRNFHLGPPDAMVVFSARGVTANPIEMAMGGRRRGLPVIAVTSVAESRAADARHSSRTPPLGHAGGGSGASGGAGVNKLNARPPHLRVARGGIPGVLPSGSVVGNEESARLFDAA